MSAKRQTWGQPGSDDEAPGRRKRRTLCARGPTAAWAGAGRCCRNSNVTGGSLKGTRERRDPSLHQDLEMQCKLPIASSPRHKIRNCPTEHIRSGHRSQQEKTGERKEEEMKSGKDRCEKSLNTPS